MGKLPLWMLEYWHLLAIACRDVFHGTYTEERLTAASQSFDFIGAPVEIALFDSADKWFITEFRGLASKGCVNESRNARDDPRVLTPHRQWQDRVIEDLLVLPDQLRAPGRTEALSSMALEEVVLDCPEGTEEAHPDTETEGLKQEWLMTLQRECNLLGLGVRRCESGRRQLKLAGERSSTTRASKLLHTVHFWNQAEIVKCRAQQADLEKRLSCLEGASREEGKVIEFPVDMDIMQLIIGLARDCKISRNKAIAGRSVVNTFELKELLVRVVGQDPDAVAATQRQLEYKRRKLSFDVDEVGYILGKNLANIREIAEKAGCLRRSTTSHLRRPVVASM
ncbi:unnamed protein product [Symbiodinium sp. CCMP2456]|nr:unnamed protein product [Symbiodinium sp. CCMP2456]